MMTKLPKITVLVIGINAAIIIAMILGLRDAQLVMTGFATGITMLILDRSRADKEALQESKEAQETLRNNFDSAKGTGEYEGRAVFASEVKALVAKGFYIQNLPSEDGTKTVLCAVRFVQGTQPVIIDSYFDEKESKWHKFVQPAHGKRGAGGR